MGKLPDAGKLRWSSIRQDVADGFGNGKIVEQRSEEESEQQDRSGHRLLRRLSLVELILNRRAAVRLTIFVLLASAVILLAARHEREARNEFQATVIRGQRPKGNQRHDHHSLNRLHAHKTSHPQKCSMLSEEFG